eukprot:TRINITY_DN42279_c0_g1_i1.p1 TRINITY_DN42279_c0_g1~~TRINITY_DN42279_c0_g1_i1.p1  ORF type:complete len:476 (-),score=69.84 TRINITY_DN42279_c0_g1_i1:14-1441(-)
MGQALALYQLDCHTCFCGVVANPPGNNMLPGNPQYDEQCDNSEEALKSPESCGPFAAKLVFDAPEPPRTSADQAAPARPQKPAKSDSGDLSLQSWATPGDAAHNSPEPVKPAGEAPRSEAHSTACIDVDRGPDLALEPRKVGRCTRWVFAFLQQPEQHSILPLQVYRRCCQSVCSGCFAICFLLLGVLLLVQSGSVPEVRIDYRKEDTHKEFKVGEDMDGDVLVSYELAGMSVNRKEFTEGKDKRVVSSFLSNAACDGADTRALARWRRGNDSLVARIEGTPGDGLAPCGVVALSMFTDNYVFERFDGSEWDRLVVDESGVALVTDSDVYAKKISGPESGSDYLTIKTGSVVSWLRPGDFYEHWKVWYRTPASSHFRNLWAVVQGGLKKGEYRVHFHENSPAWEDWGVPKKTVLLSTKHFLGSKGAMEFLGGASLILGVIQVFVLLLFVVAPYTQTCQRRPMDQTLGETEQVVPL